MINDKSFIFRLKHFLNDYLFRSIFIEKSKNIFQQFYELIYLWHKTGYVPYTYYKYEGGYLKGNDVKNFISYIPGKLWSSLSHDLLYDKRYFIMVDDKNFFSSKLNTENIQATKVFGLYVPSIGFTDKNYIPVESEEFLNNLDSDFVIKPVSESMQGAGVYIFKRSEIGDIKDFLNFLKENIKLESIVEQKVIQHDKLNELYPESVNTIRIDTLRKMNGDIIVGSAILRVGKNGRKVDNWSGHNAGIALPINLETGKLIELGYDYFFQKYDKHPNTGIIFKDFEVPYFNDVVELVKHAATLFPKIRAIGWDVAITPNGPLVIEANHSYSIEHTQAIYPMFKNRPFVDALNEYVQTMEKGKKYKKYFNRIMNQVQ